MISIDDVLLFFPTLLEVTLFVYIVYRLVTFIPSFMLSFVQKVKNPSIIYNDSPDRGSSLDTKLDRSDFGLKNLLEKWFK